MHILPSADEYAEDLILQPDAIEQVVPNARALELL
jgi:hypothetical protein